MKFSLALVEVIPFFFGIAVTSSPIEHQATNFALVEVSPNPITGAVHGGNRLPPFPPFAKRSTGTTPPPDPEDSGAGGGDPIDTGPRYSVREQGRIPPLSHKEWNTQRDDILTRYDDSTRRLLAALSENRAQPGETWPSDGEHIREMQIAHSKLIDTLGGTANDLLANPPGKLKALRLRLGGEGRLKALAALADLKKYGMKPLA